MNNLKEYFVTDWAAMTLQDWLGLGITITVFILMIALYLYVLHPANKDKLERQRFIPLEDESLPTEDRK